MINVKDMIKDSLSKFWTGYKKNVVDNLESTSTTLPLSANKGRELYEKMYPIGYIFIWSNRNSNNNTELSNIPDLSTPEKMSSYFGGTWIQINKKFLMGGVANNPQTGTPTGATGGNETVTLSANNLPSHRHTIPALSGSAASNGAHTHRVTDLEYEGNCTTGGRAAHIKTNSKTKSGNIGSTTSAGAHTHTVTTTANNTGYTGSGSAFSVLPPYVVVCIYQRVS
nr:MAG TPA: baseplate protein [Caudoviricetes sp.]